MFMFHFIDCVHFCVLSLNHQHNTKLTKRERKKRFSLDVFHWINANQLYVCVLCMLYMRETTCWVTQKERMSHVIGLFSRICRFLMISQPRNIYRESKIDRELWTCSSFHKTCGSFVVSRTNAVVNIFAARQFDGDLTNAHVLTSIHIQVMLWMSCIRLCYQGNMLDACSDSQCHNTLTHTYKQKHQQHKKKNINNDGEYKCDFLATDTFYLTVSHDSIECLSPIQKQ